MQQTPSRLRRSARQASKEPSGAETPRTKNSLKMAELQRQHKERRTQTDLPPPEPTEPARSPPPATPSAAVITTPAAAPPTSVWRSFTSMFTTPFTRKRAAEDDFETPAPSQKRQKPTEPAPTPAEQQNTTTPAPAAIEQPSTAPAPTTYERERPITTTPAPKRKRTADTTATPLPAISESSAKPKMTITPRHRTLAGVRAAQSAKAQAAQPPRRYAWEPKEHIRRPNADERIAMIREAEGLRRRLDYILEHEPGALRVKKVKVDHLPEIPHNRPGDSSSTFRVPEWDSDDEMEVDERVEVRTNIFSTPRPPAQQDTTPIPQTQHATTTISKEQQATTPLPQPPQLPAQQVTTPLPQAPAQEQQQQTSRAEPPRFSFPSVAPRPTDYSVTEAYKQACGAHFAAGLAAF